MRAKGSVLIHVLITSVIVAVISAGLMRMVLLNYTATQRAAEGVQGRKSAESSLDRMVAAWSQTNSFCASFTGYACSGVSNNVCGGTGAQVCTCTPTNAAEPTIKVCLTGGNCKVKICTPETGSSCSCP